MSISNPFNDINHHLSKLPPYSELQKISPMDLQEIRRVLPYILSSTSYSEFFTNPNAIKHTTDFGIKNLKSFSSNSVVNAEQEDLLHELLKLFENITNGIFKYSNTERRYFDKNFCLNHLSPLWSIIENVPDLDIFCSKCGALCQNILENLLNSNYFNYQIIDDQLSNILKKLLMTNSCEELDPNLLRIIIKNCSSDTKTFTLCSGWMLQNAITNFKKIDVLGAINKKDTETIQRIHDKIEIICSFISEVKSINCKLFSERFMISFEKFENSLNEITPELIYFTEFDDTYSFNLLQLVLIKFMQEQNCSKEKTITTLQELMELRTLKISNWPKEISGAFFWLCFQLYYHKSFVWTSAEIYNAIYKLFNTVNNTSNTLNVHNLKAIAFIYPLLVLKKDEINLHEYRYLSDYVAQVSLPNYIRILDQVLIISQIQLTWILFRGTCTLKVATIKFFLEDTTEKSINILAEALVVSKTENLLFQILCDQYLKSSMEIRAIQVLQKIQTEVQLDKIVPQLLTKFIDKNINVTMVLLKIGCRKISISDDFVVKILKSFSYLMKIKPVDKLLCNICVLAMSLFRNLNTHPKFHEFISVDQFWIQYLITRLGDTKNEVLAEAIIKFLTNMLSYWGKCDTTSFDCIIEVDLSNVIFTKSEKLIRRVVTFLHEILLSRKSLISLKEKTILQIFSKLCYLASESSNILGYKIYVCIKFLNDLYPDLIHSPLFSMVVERNCNFDIININMEYFELLIYWINKVNIMGTEKSYLYLPDEGYLKAVIKHVTISMPSLKRERYLRFLDAIYKDEDQTDDNNEFYV